MQVPDPLRDLVLTIYTNVMCYGASMTSTLFMFSKDCGIIQGCPASGTFFAIATDCFFTDMGAALARHAAGIA
eukprot:3079893-Pyramimonas_sp.AAC.1